MVYFDSHGDKIIFIYKIALQMTELEPLIFEQVKKKGQCKIFSDLALSINKFYKSSSLFFIFV